MTELLGPKIDSTGLFIEVGLSAESPEAVHRESEKLQMLCEKWGYRIHSRHSVAEGRRSRIFLARQADIAEDEELRLLQDRLVHSLYTFAPDESGD